MIELGALIGFALIALGMVLTPGPNMIYLVTRSVVQGRLAGFISLLGVVTGFICYLTLTIIGLTALIIAIPLAYNAIKWAGAIYLLYMAWGAIRPNARSPFELRSDTPADSPRRLYVMGLMTSLLNPKVAVLYLSLLPQFIDPSKGHVFAQSIILGSVQMLVSFSMNLVFICLAGLVSRWLQGRPQWLKAQRWIMASMLTGLAVRLAADPGRS